MTRQRLQIDCSANPRVHPEHKDECDLNLLMSRYIRTGQMPEAPPAQYLDITQATDYQTAQNIKIQADQAFMALPAKVRKDFNNNPAEFLLALEQPDNADYFRDVGIFEALPPVEESAPKAPDSDVPKEVEDPPKSK